VLFELIHGLAGKHCREGAAFVTVKVGLANTSRALSIQHMLVCEKKVTKFIRALGTDL
jgi:hypothetical protein